MTPDCMTNHQHQSLIETLYRDQKAKVIVDHINHREIVRDGMRYFFGYDSKVTQEWPEPGWMFYRLEKET